jgi:transcriptional regulator with XRE-family HTH domain
MEYQVKNREYKLHIVLENVMRSHPVTGEKTTQKALADYLDVRSQTVSLYMSFNPKTRSIPPSDKLLMIADYFGLSVDYLLTGVSAENTSMNDILGFSEQTLDILKLIKEGYFEDTPDMLAVVDTLLGDKDFYLSIEKAVQGLSEKGKYEDKYQEFLEWKSARFLESFLTEFFSKNLTNIFKQTIQNEKKRSKRRKTEEE